MNFLRKYCSQMIGIILISTILYFGSYFGLRLIHLPPKIVVAGKAATVQVGTSGRQTNDAPIEVPLGISKVLNRIYKPLNGFCRVKTGFGLYFMEPNETGRVFIEMPQFHHAL